MATVCRSAWSSGLPGVPGAAAISFRQAGDVNFEGLPGVRYGEKKEEVNYGPLGVMGQRRRQQVGKASHASGGGAATFPARRKKLAIPMRVKSQPLVLRCLGRALLGGTGVLALKANVCNASYWTARDDRCCMD